MAKPNHNIILKSAVGIKPLPRIFVYSLGFIRNRPLVHLMRAMGWPPKFGLPRAGDAVGIWGRKPVSKRGRAVARWRNLPLISFEDGFLRSVQTGRQGAQSLSLIADDLGIYFETGQTNRLRVLIEQSESLDPEALKRAEDGIELLRRHGLSKYNDYPLEAHGLPDEFILVVDQTRDDASIIGAGATADDFAQMLAAAKRDHPNLPIVVKTHPETMAGKRRGYFSRDCVDSHVILFDQPVSPWTLFDRAQAVYVVSSQMGMEAIFAGHTPHVFGNAFYCGWGLTHDNHAASQPLAKRSSAQIFHAAYLQYCQWYDPFFRRQTEFETTARILATQASATRQAQRPLICHGMRLWKRGFLKYYLQGSAGPPRFIEDVNKAIATAKEKGAAIAVWAGKETEELREKAEAAQLSLLRVEDGFLRSAGLGAELVRPVSLAFDDLGIYYDPNKESRLERLIASATELPEQALQRAESLRWKLVAAGLSKYNLGGEMPSISPRKGQKIILIPGQVEDDASILKGTDKIRTNTALIAATRALFPDEFLIYKSHPDVVKGLRKGQVAADVPVDLILSDADISALLDRVDMVATMTSLTGFEALLRGKEVICFGAPFYAGWGLTTDKGQISARRRARPNLAGLVHATLIGYPRYWDPVTGKPCPVETVLERLATGSTGRGSGTAIRLLAKLQGLFASYAHLWR